MITAEKLMAQVHAKDADNMESFKTRGRGTDESADIQEVIAACPELKPMLQMSVILPPQALFGLGIELGYAIAQAEQMEKELAG